MPSINQFSFSGGMNSFLDDLSLGENEYVKLFNGRIRNGVVANKKATLVEAPGGKKQGLYAAGNIILLFLDGFAYYKLIGISTDWTFIEGFQMDSEVEFIYGDFLPVASRNYKRLSTTDNVNADIKLAISSSTGSPACFLAQDGINQPFIIQSDGSARVAQKYSQWTTNIQEYVPIGKQTVFINGKTYVVAVDGKSIYHSVSGDPLNFVVNIESDGDKGGDAETTSFAVDFNIITAISKLNSNSFLIGNSRFVYLITPDYSQERKVFGEPTFVQQPIEVGVMNQRSVATSINGDAVLIDADGLKSLNAVSQLENEGNNSIFSSYASKFFDDGITRIYQTENYSASVVFDNYVLFAVNSIFGYGILVYDTVLEKFVSFDQPLDKPIKQFAQTFDGNNRHLYAITEDELYELYSSDEYEYVVLQTRSFSNIQQDKQSKIGDHKTELIQALFTTTDEDAKDISVITLVDGSRTEEGITKTIDPMDGGIYTFGIPVLNPTANISQRLTFVPGSPISGTKLSYVFYWNNKSTLNYFQAISTSVDTQQSLQQMSL